MNKTPCMAVVDDYENAERYNLSRVLLIPKAKPCSRAAKFKLGDKCFCALHTKLAKDGLVEETGEVADKSVRRDVRKYPHKFPHGVYTWAKDLEPEAL